MQCTDNVRENLSPTPSGALNRVNHSIKSQKTKNSSNKIKERTSISGAIVKLLERDGGDGLQSSELSANLTMTLMRQMSAMNNSMDRQDRQEDRLDSG